MAVVKIGILVLDIGISGSQQDTTTADREGQQVIGSGHDTPFSINNLDCNKGQPMSCKSCLVSRKPDSSRCPCRLYLMLFVACLSTQNARLVRQSERSLHLRSRLFGHQLAVEIEAYLGLTAIYLNLDGLALPPWPVPALVGHVLHIEVFTLPR